VPLLTQLNKTNIKIEIEIDLVLKYMYLGESFKFRNNSSHF